MSFARRAAQRLGSALVLAGPAVFLLGFFAETPLATIDRPWTFAGIVGSAVGITLHALAARPSGSWSRR